MPAQLVALSDGPSILIDKPILLLGRHPECDVQIESRKISRRHCCIAQVNDYLVVRDLDSTNGIRINGVRVVEGQLHSGDELTIGNSRYQVTWDDNLAVPAAPIMGGKAAPQPHQPRPAPRTALEADDEMLEDCDEPIPLLDTARRPFNPEPPHKPRAVSDDDSVVLPDEGRLQPDKAPNGPTKK